MEAGLGHPNKAMRLFERAVSARPGDGAVWQAYALLLRVSSASVVLTSAFGGVAALPVVGTGSDMRRLESYGMSSDEVVLHRMNFPRLRRSVSTASLQSRHEA